VKFSLILIALILSGCATPDYKVYVEAQNSLAVQHQLQATAQANAKSVSETARFNALGKIAETGDTAAKVAAVMALQFGSQNSSQTNSQITQLAAPQPNQLLQWASILVPALSQAYSISKNAEVSIAASNNAMQTSIATTNGFVNIAGKIQVPAANISTVTTDNHAVTTTTSNTTTSTLEGTGVLGDGSYSTTANPTTYTMSGTGTLGSGTYSTTDNNSTNPIVQITPTVIQPTVITPVITTP